MAGTEDDDRNFFDTLSSYEEELDGIESGEELHDHIFAPFYNQNIAADVLTGPLTLRNPSHWGSGREFETSVVYIRSSPRGCLGKPLLRGEFRVISILIIDRETARCRVSIFRLFLTDSLIPENPSDEIRSSFGPPGVPIMGLTLFERHIATVGDGTATPMAASVSGHHLVIPSTVLVSEQMDLLNTPRVVAGHHDFPVARILGGVRVLDRIRHSAETASLKAWVDASMSHVAHFGEDMVCAGRGEQTSDLVFAAKMLCDGLSASGIIDLLAADTSSGGLPDALSTPFQIQLVLAVATRVACHPHRFDLWPSTATDRFAAEEVARSFEMCASPLIQVLEADDEERHDLFAVDVLTRTVLTQIQQKFGARRAKAKKKDMKAIDYEENLCKSIKDVLHRIGVGLCVDVCGPIQLDLYDEYGYSTGILDPTTVARAESICSKGATPQISVASARRLTSRSERQAALFKLLHDVNAWLHDGKWKGQQISTPNDANPNIAWRTASSTPRHRVFRTSGDDMNEDWMSRLNADALAVAQVHLETLLTKGVAAAAETHCLTAVPFGRHSRIACSDCSRGLTPSEAYGFTIGIRAACQRCGRRRCLDCGRAPDCVDRLNCLRCCHDRRST